MTIISTSFPLKAGHHICGDRLPACILSATNFGIRTQGAGMYRIFMAVAAGILLAAPAGAADKTDVMSVVRHWAAAFNQGDMQSMAATCTDQASIIDDFAPHVWTGAGACTRWASDFQNFVKTSGSSDAAVTLGKPWHIEVTGDLAYVVAPTTYSFKQNGKPVQQAGVVTLALQKGPAGWQMIGWAWADH
jgi:ketosteroid isomerase-like protein